MQSAIRNLGLLICSAFIAAGSAQAQDPAFQFFVTGSILPSTLIRSPTM
jgi:hypothetical protein